MKEQKETTHSRVANSKKERLHKKMAGTILLCLFAVLIFQTAAASADEERVRISIQVKSQEMLQEEAVPSLEASVTEDGELQTVLDKDTGYTAQQLIDTLNGGSGYTLACEADGITEGDYPIQIVLAEEIRKKLADQWVGRVFVKTEDGVLTVKNKTGEWEGNKFRRYDGSYVENEFVSSKGKTYYLGADQMKMTGWQQIPSGTYCFDDKGVMQSGGWKEKDDIKCYLNADGKMAIGWTEIDGTTYYFNSDGSKMTGKQQIGSLKCVFSEDGKLESKESSLDPNKPMMALTFDDGPGERTSELLDVLKQYNAHATFFMLGKQVAGYEDTIKKMVEAGCEIGSHTFSHPQLPKLSPGEIQAQMGDTDSQLVQACGQPATVMRPPYGAINDKVKENVGKPMILWNIDTLDWKTKNAQATIDNVLQTADDGDIVLMHDIHSTTVDAAIALIPLLINNGYQLVTVSELAEARGITMEHGGKYTDFNK